MNINWQNKEMLRSSKLDERIASFLFQTGSLTNYIQQRCQGAFNIELKSESWRDPILEESYLLKLEDQENVFIRESWLKCENQSLVYARTTIPRKTLEGKGQKLAQSGTNPLGEILFADKTMSRSNLLYAEIPPECELYKTSTNDSLLGEKVWGRQSIFYIEQKPLLIIEIFLPTIIECTHC